MASYRHYYGLILFSGSGRIIYLIDALWRGSSKGYGLILSVLLDGNLEGLGHAHPIYNMKTACYIGVY